MNVKQIVAACVGLVAVLSALAYIGLDMPKIATQRHVAASTAALKVDYDRLAGSVKSVQELSLENAIAREELRAGNLEIQAAQLEAAGVDSRALEDLAKLLRKSVAKRERQLLQLEN